MLEKVGPAPRPRVLLRRAGAFVRWNSPRTRQEAAHLAPQEVGSVLFETSCRFVYLFKLSWLPLPHPLGTFFGRNEVDFPQFETVVFQHDGGHRAVPFTSDNDEAIIRSEPHLESFLFAVWRRTDFAKTELLEKCKRGPHGLHELRQRWRLDIVGHDNSPTRPQQSVVQAVYPIVTERRATARRPAAPVAPVPHDVGLRVLPASA